MKIAVIGATRGFGLWLAKFIKSNFSNEEVIITGRNVERGNKVAKENNLIFTNDNIKAVEDADIVIFSTPISKMEETIRNVGPYVKKGAIVGDVCSIKTFPYQAMKKYCKQAKLIIPIHPMFGPYIQDIAGQIVVLTPDEEVKDTKEYTFLLNFLKGKGVKIIQTTPTYHDKMMAVVQGLTHINMFTIGETIRRLGISVQESLNFVSPIYKLMIASVARYLGHDPRLYGDIQMYNPYILDVHKKFMEVMNDFSNSVENKNEEQFINLVNQAKEYFGPTTDFGQKYTDKVIFLMTQQIEKALKNIGNEVRFENVYTGKIIKGKIVKYEDEKVKLENGLEIDLNEYIIL